MLTWNNSKEGTKKGDTKGGGGLGFSVTMMLTVVNFKPPNYITIT